MCGCFTDLKEMPFVTPSFCGAFLGRDSVKRGQAEQKVLAGAVCHRGVERGSFVWGWGRGDPGPSGI